MKKTSFDMDELVDKLAKFGKSIDRFLSGNEKQLVLEVGNQATKMIEYVIKPKEIEVVNGFVTNTPNNSIQKDRLINVDALVNTISQSIKQTNIKTKEFVVSITSKEIITREMPVHKMSDKDLKNFVQFNASDIFPVKLEDYILGYNINEKGTTNKLMIAAIPKDIVIPYIELGQKLGLQLKGFNYSGYELYNFLNFELGVLPNAYLALDIGAKNTNIVIISNGVLKFNKIIPKGYSEATKCIMEELNCNFVKAEQLKRQYSTIDLNEEVDNESDEAVVIRHTQKCFEHIIKDALRIIEFYNTNNSKNKINRIYLIGTIGRINGVEKYFAEKMNISAKVIKSLRKVSFNKTALELKSRQLNYINSFGAHKLLDNEFNFIKGELKIQKIPFVLTLKFHKLACACIAVMMLFIAMGVYTNKNISNKITEYNEFIDSKQEFVNLNSKVNSKSSEVANLENKLEIIGNSGEDYLTYLDVVQKTVDELRAKALIYISKYTLKKNSIELECSVPIAETATSEQYSILMGMGNEFKSSLENKFKEFNLKIAKSDLSKTTTTSTNISFTITIMFD